MHVRLIYNLLFNGQIKMDVVDLNSPSLLSRISIVYLISPITPEELRLSRKLHTSPRISSILYSKLSSSFLVLKQFK